MWPKYIVVEIYHGQKDQIHWTFANSHSTGKGDGRFGKFFPLFSKEKINFLNNYSIKIWNFYQRYFFKISIKCPQAGICAFICLAVMFFQRLNCVNFKIFRQNLPFWRKPTVGYLVLGVPSCPRGYETQIHHSWDISWPERPNPLNFRELSFDK